MSNSGRRAAVCVCVCIFLCLHIIWINTHRNEALKRQTSCRRQKQQAETQSFQSVQQTTLSTFVSLPPPGHDSSFLSAYWRPSICSVSLLPFFHHSSFLFFFSSDESFQTWPLCTWKEPLRVTKPVNQSQTGLIGLGYVSLIPNDRRKPEMDFRGSWSQLLTCTHMRAHAQMSLVITILFWKWLTTSCSPWLALMFGLPLSLLWVEACVLICLTVSTKYVQTKAVTQEVTWFPQFLSCHATEKVSRRLKGHLGIYA